MHRAPIVALSLAVLAGSAAAELGESGNNEPRANLAWEGVPTEPIALDAGASTHVNLTLRFSASNFACTEDSVFPVSLSGAGLARPGSDVAEFPVNAGLYTGEDAHEDRATIIVIVEVSGAANGTVEAPVTANLDTGMPEACFGAGAFPQATATANLTVEVTGGGEDEGENETVQPPANETGEDEELNETTEEAPPAEANAKEPFFVPGPSTLVAVAAFAAASVAFRTKR